MFRAYVDGSYRDGRVGWGAVIVKDGKVYGELCGVLDEEEVLGTRQVAGELKAVKEVIEIVEKSGCTGGQIAHHKVAGKAYWGASTETIRLMEEANTRGISITCDQYPYNRGQSGLMTSLPSRAPTPGFSKSDQRHDPA